jgi:hypothetical protein
METARINGPMKFYIIILNLMMLLLARNISAEEKPLSTCEAEIKLHCTEQSAPDKILLCLYEHKDSLSVNCKQGLEQFAGAKKQASEVGGSALTAFGGLNNFGPPIAMASYEGYFIPGDAGSKRQMENKLNVSVPVYKSEGNSVAMSLAGGKLNFGKSFLLNTGKSVSSEWNREEVGAQFSHMGEGRRTWSLKISAGYAGDASFASKDASYSFTGTYGKPGSGNDYWVFMVLMSNNGPLANYIPLPGFIYIHRTENFTGMFGFPVMSMQWTPVNPWAFSLSFFGLTGQAEAIYGALGSTQTFFGYSYLQQSYIPEVRTEDKDRLKIHEQKIGPGLRIPIGKKSLIGMQTGWSFDRTVSIGKSSFGSNKESTDLESGMFFNFSLKHAF